MELSLAQIPLRGNVTAPGRNMARKDGVPPHKDQRDQYKKVKFCQAQTGVLQDNSKTAKFRASRNSPPDRGRDHGLSIRPAVSIDSNPAPPVYQGTGRCCCGTEGSSPSKKEGLDGGLYSSSGCHRDKTHRQGGLAGGCARHHLYTATGSHI